MEYLDLATVSEERYAEAMEELFASEGWLIYLSELYALSETFNDIQNVVSMEDLWRKRGKLDMIGFSLNYEKIMSQDDNESP